VGDDEGMAEEREHTKGQIFEVGPDWTDDEAGLERDDLLGVEEGHEVEGASLPRRCGRDSRYFRFPRRTPRGAR